MAKLELIEYLLGLSLLFSALRGFLWLSFTMKKTNVWKSFSRKLKYIQVESMLAKGAVRNYASGQVLAGLSLKKALNKKK